jgi:hypothetical protein
MSQIDVTATTTIDAPREDVARYVIDHRNDPVWIGGITESELLGEPPIAVGSRVRRVASFMGKRVEYVNEVVRLEPGSVLEMRSVKSPFPMVVTYAFEDTDGGAPTPRATRSRPSPTCSARGASTSPRSTATSSPEPAAPTAGQRRANAPPLGSARPVWAARRGGPARVGGLRLAPVIEEEPC